MNGDDQERCLIVDEQTPSGYEQVTRNKVANVEGEVTDVKKSIIIICKDITELRNRPPVWVTMIFTCMGFIIGALTAIIWR